jgi:hypothetical protein
MSDSKNRFKNIKPLMVYVYPDQPKKIKDFAISRKLTVSQFAREAFELRMSETDNLFDSGFNAGIQEAMRIVRQTDGAKMMFPSGKSFGQLVCDQIGIFMREKRNE